MKRQGPPDPRREIPFAIFPLYAIKETELIQLEFILSESAGWNDGLLPVHG
jgi:hypothetical protein